MGNALDQVAERKLTPFKRQIGYDNIVSNLGPERRYIVDWIAMLSEFVDAEGEQWTADEEASFYVSGPQGNAKIDVSNGEDAISVELYSVDGGQRAAIDMALGIASYGTTVQIVMSVMRDNCPGDFCLIYDDGDEVTSLYMVKGNMLVMLESADSRSVLPVARYITSAMEKRQLDSRKSPLNEVQLQLKTDRNTIKQGETFEFTVDPKQLFNDEEWLIDVRPVSDEELEYVKEEPGRFTYKALKKGPARITVAVMHKRTLQVKEEAFIVNVN